MQLFIGSVDISNLANNLSSFGTGSKTFFLVADSLPNTSFAKAKSLFKALSSLSEITDFLPLLTGSTLSNFGEELVFFIDKAEQFFIKSGELNVESVQNITSALSPFFDTVTAFKVDKLTVIAQGLDSVSNSTTAFSKVLGQTVIDVKTNTTSIISSLTVCKDDGVKVLSEFSLQGSVFGKSLMQNMANAITANAYLIRNAVQSAVNSVTISVPSIATNAASQAKSQARSRNMVGLATGGYVKTTGIAVLHPDEVVVNDVTTKKLQGFLDRAETSSISIPANPPVVNSETTLSTTSHNFVVNNTSQPTTQTEEKSIDNSVTFEAGSVVIQIMNATEAELEKAAEKLMAIIARKQQLKAMATRA